MYPTIDIPWWVDAWQTHSENCRAAILANIKERNTPIDRQSLEPNHIWLSELWLNKVGNSYQYTLLTLLILKELQFIDAYKSYENLNWQSYGYKEFNSVAKKEKRIYSTEESKEISEPLVKLQQAFHRDINWWIDQWPTDVWELEGQAVSAAVQTKNDWLLTKIQQLEPQKILNWRDTDGKTLLDVAIDANYGWLAHKCVTTWNFPINGVNDAGGRPLSYVRNFASLNFLLKFGADPVFPAPAKLRLDDRLGNFSTSDKNNAEDLLKPTRTAMKALTQDIDVDTLMSTNFSGISAFQKQYQKFTPSQNSSQALLTRILTSNKLFLHEPNQTKAIDLILRKSPDKNPWFIQNNGIPWAEEFFCRIFQEQEQNANNLSRWNRNSALPDAEKFWRREFLTETDDVKNMPEKWTFFQKIAASNPDAWLAIAINNFQAMTFVQSNNPKNISTQDLTDLERSVRHALLRMWLLVTWNTPELGMPFIAHHDKTLTERYLNELPEKKRFSFYRLFNHKKFYLDKTFCAISAGHEEILCDRTIMQKTAQLPEIVKLWLVENILSQTIDQLKEALIVRTSGYTTALGIETSLTMDANTLNGNLITVIKAAETGLNLTQLKQFDRYINYQQEALTKFIDDIYNQKKQSHAGRNLVLETAQNIFNNLLHYSFKKSKHSTTEQTTPAPKPGKRI